MSSFGFSRFVRVWSADEYRRTLSRERTGRNDKEVVVDRDQIQERVVGNSVRPSKEDSYFNANITRKTYNIV